MLTLLRRLGQALLAAMFIKGGFEAARNPGGRVAKAAALGLPDPALVVRANGAAMVVGGVALALNVLPKLAAAGLVASLIPTTIAGHPFWREEQPAARNGQLIQFLKNTGLLGGLVLVLAERGRGAERPSAAS